MKTLTTARLSLRALTLDDAPFILRLLNEPSWLRYIGDKKVRTLEDARGYLRDGPIAMVAKFGFGLRCVERDGVPVGVCGIIQRDTLPDADIGFAFLPEHCGQGYALEAAQAVLDHAGREHGLRRIVAITTVDNERSIRLLEKLGFVFQRFIAGPTLDEKPSRLRLFARETAAPREP